MIKNTILNIFILFACVSINALGITYHRRLIRRLEEHDENSTSSSESDKRSCNKRKNKSKGSNSKKTTTTKSTRHKENRLSKRNLKGKKDDLNIELNTTSEYVLPDPAVSCDNITVFYSSDETNSSDSSSSTKGSKKMI